MDAGNSKSIDLDCGIPYHRLAAWLDNELRLERCEDGWTFSDDEGACTVVLSELENRSFRHVEFERTRLFVEGDEQALDAFYRLFTLRFLSAGG